MHKNDFQKDLIELINKSFLRDYPDDREICFTLSESDRYEGNIIFNNFGFKKWNALIGDDFSLLIKVFEKVKTFSYFTPTGFIYYLPAFLIYVSQHKDEEFMEKLFYRLQPGNSQSRMEKFGEVFSLFNDQEVMAIKESLSLLNNIWSSWGVIDNWAKAALTNYWDYV